MNRLIVAAIYCLLSFILPSVTYAISAQWDLDPISGDWNTAANWTPNGIPNGPADTATFGLSNTTNVSISANTEVNGITFTSAATNPYFITVSSNLTLTLSGTGITNNSGTDQYFFVGDFNQPGRMHFTNSASAGNAQIICEGASSGDFSSLQFSNRSTAGTATITYEASAIEFFNHSTAGNAAFNGGGDSINFFNSSTAGSATVFNFGFHGSISFYDNSTAGNAVLGGGEEGSVSFSGHSTAENATIMCGQAGFIGFSDFSSAGRATIEAFGSQMGFFGFSKGGTSAIELIASQEFTSSLGISGHAGPGVTIGSLEGDETATVFLGSNNLTVGSNNLSTTFSGVIQDGAQNSGIGGSLTKIGTGTFILSGANTYTGDTNANRGALQVDGSITSNTFVNHRGTLAGTGTVQGNVMNTDFGTVRPGGSLGAPGVLTVVHNYTQAQYATLMIQIAGTNASDFSVLNVLGNANLNGYLDPVLLNGFVPTIGQTFTFLNYASFTGEFSQIKHRFFDNGLQWAVIYEDNHAILTVEQHVPDQGSTLLLLTVGLLCLAIFRRQLLRSHGNASSQDK